MSLGFERAEGRTVLARKRHEGPVPLELLQIKPSDLMVAPGNFATTWTSKSASFGTLHGRFILAGDAILSAYESATGRYRGQDTILRRDDKHYSARGALLDGSKILSAWSVELRQ